MPLLSRSALFGATLFALGCPAAPPSDGAATTQTAAAPDTSAAPTPAAPTGPVAERWIVVSHTFAGVSAIGEDEAKEWYGRALALGSDIATFGADQCERPAYDRSTASAGSLLVDDFRITPAQLGLADSASIEVTHVSCAGSPWSSPAGDLYRFADGRAFIVGEGVWFQLVREGGAASPMSTP